MCLGVPARIINIEGNDALVDLAGNKLRTSLALLDDVTTGEYVLIHAGYAIQKIDEEEAKKTLELIEILGLNNETQQA